MMIRGYDHRFYFSLWKILLLLWRVDRLKSNINSKWECNYLSSYTWVTSHLYPSGHIGKVKIVTQKKNTKRGRKSLGVRENFKNKNKNRAKERGQVRNTKLTKTQINTDRVFLHYSGYCSWCKTTREVKVVRSLKDFVSFVVRYK